MVAADKEGTAGQGMALQHVALQHLTTSTGMHFQT